MCKDMHIYIYKYMHRLTVTYTYTFAYACKYTYIHTHIYIYRSIDRSIDRSIHGCMSCQMGNQNLCGHENNQREFALCLDTILWVNVTYSRLSFQPPIRTSAVTREDLAGPFEILAAPRDPLEKYKNQIWVKHVHVISGLQQ